ncbi:MAG TPA: nuclear transport factor 2 family protein [Xanthomonadales bacterium]|nr:nuclear transport factor 2 family protein [Xanthomonadales bacterium]
MTKDSLALKPAGILRTMMLVAVLWSLLLPAWAASPDENPNQTPDETLIALLDDFLAGASRNDVAAHERFWSDDLVYTSSAGERYGKDQILGSLESNSEANDDEPAMEYGREALLVRVYGDTAVVTFRLVGSTQSEPPSVANFYNTGTFLLRDGEWRAIAWQATRIPDES